MQLSQKLLVSILAAASLFGISLANQSNHQVNASMRHYTRYINGNYNAYHNVPGRRNAYLMHYGHNYRNDRVSTYGTYYKFGRHYTKLNRARRWFGYMNVKGLNTRPIHIRVRRHAYRRPTRHAYRKPVRRTHQNKIYYVGSQALNYSQLKKFAKSIHESVSECLRTDSTPKPNKYWNVEGDATNLANHQAARLIVKDLNKIRAAKGIQPLTITPNMEQLAKQRLAQADNDNSNNPHVDYKTGKSYLEEDANADNIDLPAYGENISSSSDGTYEIPSQIAHEENINWDAAHRHIRESPDYNQVGVAIDDEKVVEDFAG